MSDERIELSRAELIEVCVRFVEAWGMIDHPGSFQWRSFIRDAGSPEQFREELDQALETALSWQANGPQATPIAAMWADLKAMAEEDAVIAIMNEWERKHETRITPEMAKELLKPLTRPLDPAKVEEFRRAMESGDWKP